MGRSKKLRSIFRHYQWSHHSVKGNAIKEKNFDRMERKEQLQPEDDGKIKEKTFQQSMKLEDTKTEKRRQALNSN